MSGYRKACSHCGEDFLAATGFARFCGPVCKKAVRAERQREKVATEPKEPKERAPRKTGPREKRVLSDAEVAHLRRLVGFVPGGDEIELEDHIA